MTLFSSSPLRGSSRVSYDSVRLQSGGKRAFSPRCGGHSNQESSMKTTAKLSDADLAQFTGGTNEWYRHPLNTKILFTDGAKYVADEGGGYWLLNEIALSQRSQIRVAEEPFQVWTLTVNSDQTGTITVEDGNYTVLFTKALDYTDFPAPEIILWFSRSSNVIYCTRRALTISAPEPAMSKTKQRPGTRRSQSAQLVAQLGLSSQLMAGLRRRRRNGRDRLQQ